MRVFISVPMHDRPMDEIRADIMKAASAIGQIFYNEEPLEVIHTADRVAPEGCGRLWHLGQAIADLDGCDAVYFCPGWEVAKGCQVEHRVCELYDIQRIEA